MGLQEVQLMESKTSCLDRNNVKCTQRGGKKQKNTFQCRKQHLNPINCCFVPRLSQISQVCLGSLRATSCTAGFLLQANTQRFICPARSSRALIRTHRFILTLSLPPLHWNSSLPSTDSHVTTLFRWDAQTASCVSDSHTPTLPSALRHRS